jgi:hypothetical protein
MTKFFTLLLIFLISLYINYRLGYEGFGELESTGVGVIIGIVVLFILSIIAVVLRNNV